MRSSRQKITLLKNKIIEVLPDENDILGFSGISRLSIINSLNDSYRTLSVLNQYNNSFEVVFAKRKISQSIDAAFIFLNNFTNSDDDKTAFNEFLFSISNIRYAIKEAYISVSEQPLRLDEDIQFAKEELEKFNNALINIGVAEKSIKELIENSKQNIDDIQAKHKQSIENITSINNSSVLIESLIEKFKAFDDKVSAWNVSTAILEEYLKKHKTTIETLSQESIRINKEIIEEQNKVSNISTTLDKQIEKNRINQIEIQKTIEDVSRAGMAGSFKKRKDELLITQIIWAILTLLSVGGLVWLSYSIIKPLIENTDIKIIQLYVKIPIFASAVWLGWFCSKQYGFISRIREDYSYKYAISMAFEGYKNEVNEVDPELMTQLLQLTVLNISKSPVNIFETKNNHGSPYNEMFENFSKRFFQKNTEAELQ